MSAFIFHENKLTPLDSFILLEALTPIETPFGTNHEMDDKQVDLFKDENGNDIWCTFFKVNTKYHIAILSSSGEIGFGTCDFHATKPGMYSVDRSFVTSSLMSFNRFMFVALQLAKNTKHFFFSSADPSLGRLYDGIVKNTFFLASIKNFGWSYVGKYESKHLFKKS